MSSPKTSMIKTSTASKAAMAVVVAAISFTALTPAAFAAGPDRGRDVQAHRQGGDMDRQGGMRFGGRGAGLLALGCGPNAAERTEHALVALSYRVNPTGDQVQLFDALKTAALDAQKELATTCDAVLPDRTAEAGAAPATTGPTNMLEALQARHKIEEARVAALGDVLPAFEAFFNSLTDEQKATLELRGPRDGRGPGAGGEGRPAPHQNRNG
jgi:hypothetical protein